MDWVPGLLHRAAGIEPARRLDLLCTEYSVSKVSYALTANIPHRYLIRKIVLVLGLKRKLLRDYQFVSVTYFKFISDIEH